MDNAREPIHAIMHMGLPKFDIVMERGQRHYTKIVYANFGKEAVALTEIK
jgi:hypothetical protein